MGRYLAFALIAAYLLALAWQPRPGSAEQAASEPTADTQPVAGQALVVSDWVTPDSVTFTDLRCLDGLDRDHAVVGGALMDGDRVVQSCLFSTEDGGANWRPLGPALPGARVMAVHRRADAVWALGHEHEGAGGALFLLRSTDRGHSWNRHPVDVRPYPGDRLSSGELQFVDGSHGVLIAGFARHGMERARFVTSDGGANWRFVQSRNDAAPPLDREQVTTGDGTTWRLRDGLIERRAADQDWFVPTPSQPLEDEAVDDAPRVTASL